MAEVVITKIQIRRGDEASWTSLNPILSDGEMGFERDTNKLKIGDGIQTWNELSYLTASDGGYTSEQIQDLVNTLIIAGEGISKVYDDPSNTLTISISDELFTSAYKDKLDNIEDGATQNSTDSELRDRSTHTGTQTASTISDIQSVITNNTSVLNNTAKRSYPVEQETLVTTGIMVDINSAIPKNGLYVFGIKAGINGGNLIIGWRVNAGVSDPTSDADFDVFGFAS